MSDIGVSVVIPVKNGEKYLGAALKAVFSQKIDSGFEVIIVDSGSTDKTLDIIKEYPVSLYQIKENDFNHGLTRNLGVSKALGRYVILMTQDVIPCGKYWMERLMKNLERDDRVAGAYSRQAPHKESSVLARLRANRFFTSNKERRNSQIDKEEDYNNLPPLEKYRFCNFDNVSSCIRKEVWENFRFYETEFGEDIEWAKRVLEAGYKIVYEPESAVYHSHEYSIAGWYKRNLVNYSLLRSIFGIGGADNLCTLLIFTLIYAFSDFCGLFRLCVSEKSIRPFFSGALPILPYSLAGALGQYKGVRKILKIA